MAPFLDARIPVHFTPQAQAQAECAWLLQDDAPAPPDMPTARFHLPAVQADHPADCRCCQPRGPVVMALSGLFLARVRGEIGFFRHVIAITLNQQGEDAVKAALASDPFLLARFRAD